MAGYFMICTRTGGTGAAIEPMSSLYETANLMNLGNDGREVNFVGDNVLDI